VHGLSSACQPFVKENLGKRGRNILSKNPNISNQKHARYAADKKRCGFDFAVATSPNRHIYRWRSRINFLVDSIIV
jgi:hypothetical protein